MITKVVNVDLHLPIYERLTAKQGDIASRFILFHLLDGDTPFDLTGKSVRMYARKPDKTEIFNNLVINDKTKGYCTLELTSQCLAKAGIVKMELYISQSGKVLTSIPFELEVIACINNINSIVSTNEFSALEAALRSLQDFDRIKSEVEKIHNDFYNVKVIDLKNEEDFDINNISTCVNRVFSTIESYTTVKLNADVCYIASPINITMKEGCELILNCKIKCKTDFNAININGNRVSNTIFIKSLESFDKVNFNTVAGCGLTLDNYYNSSIKIGELLGFNTGLLIKGTLGSQYNKIDFFSICNCNEPIKLLTTEETQWVNENTFTGGRIGGNVGITLNGISGKDIINNNKFYNIGFEGVKELLIKSIGARYNHYFNPRVLENYPEIQWVDETGSCMGNKYYFTFPVNINMFKLECLSQIIGTVTNGTKTISQTGAFCDWDITSEKMVMQYNYYLNGILMTDKDFDNDGGTITLVECFKEVYCKLSTSARKLRIAKHLLYNGFSFNLHITSATTGKLQLEYYNKNGGVTSGTNFLGNGVYKVTMYNDLLVYTKIGEEFKIV